MGGPALDVLIVGGGQSGIAIAFGLLRATVTNILVVDREDAGRRVPGPAMPGCGRCAPLRIIPVPISISRFGVSEMA